MALEIKYRVVEKYAVTAELYEPMHIGAAGGDKGEILVHPVDDVPFIQAAAIAGVFRRYCERTFPIGTVEKYFGQIRREEVSSDQEGAEEGNQSDNEKSEKPEEPCGSRFRFSDGYFFNTKDKVGLELRPRIAINPKTGSVAISEVKGSKESSGHKFEMEYIGKGAKCRFVIYDMSLDASVDNEGKSEGRKILEQIFEAVNDEAVQFGGQKSNGCGYMKIDKVEFRRFDLSDTDQLRDWIEDDFGQIQKWYKGEDEALSGMQPINFKSSESRTIAYTITVIGKTENRLLVKAIAVDNKDGSTSDARNITNYTGEYIIPASSLKGAFRARTEKILRRIGKGGKNSIYDIMRDSFGSDIEKKEKISGNLRFFDTVVKDFWSGSNDTLAERSSANHKIHIDKFTGGVMNKALVTENAVGGGINIKINILNRNSPDRTCAVILMVLRDLANGQFNLGSGWASGQGFIDVEKVIVKPTEGEVELDFKNYSISGDKGIIEKCMKELNKEGA